MNNENKVGAAPGTLGAVVLHGDRPGRIKPFGDRWDAQCGVGCCLWHAERVTYQEASIELTRHLDERHAGWDMQNVPVSSGAASAPYAPAAGSEGRCPTCRQRNSRAGERTLDDGSVIVWYCNVQGCSNSADYPNAEREVRT